MERREFKATLNISEGAFFMLQKKMKKINSHLIKHCPVCDHTVDVKSQSKFCPRCRRHGVSTKLLKERAVRLDDLISEIVQVWAAEQRR